MPAPPSAERPTTGVERTPASAWNVHAMHPVRASSAYTIPFRLPTKTRLPTIVTWDPGADARAYPIPFRLPTKTRLPRMGTGDPEADTPGKPKAHLSVSRGMSPA